MLNNLLFAIYINSFENLPKIVPYGVADLTFRSDSSTHTEMHLENS
jgi:hypothetical protein